MKGNVDINCSRCGSSEPFFLDEELKLLLSDGIYKGDDEEFLVIEIENSLIDFDEIIQSELNSIKVIIIFVKTALEDNQLFEKNFKENNMAVPKREEYLIQDQQWEELIIKLHWKDLLKIAMVLGKCLTWLTQTLVNIKLMLKVAIDAMGGDFGPEPIIEGLVEALRNNINFTAIAVGNKKTTLNLSHLLFK